MTSLGGKKLRLGLHRIPCIYDIACLLVQGSTLHCCTLVTSCAHTALVHKLWYEGVWNNFVAGMCYKDAQSVRLSVVQYLQHNLYIATIPRPSLLWNGVTFVLIDSVHSCHN